MSMDSDRDPSDPQGLRFGYPRGGTYAALGAHFRRNCRKIPLGTPPFASPIRICYNSRNRVFGVLPFFISFS